VLPPVLLTAAYGLVVAFRGFYVDAGWTIGQAWKRMTDWSALPDWGVRALAVAVAVTSLVAFAVAVRSAWRRQGRADGSTAPRTPALAGSAGASVA
jgi:hypothetical protein